MQENVLFGRFEKLLLLLLGFLLTSVMGGVLTHEFQSRRVFSERQEDVFNEVTARVSLRHYRTYHLLEGKGGDNETTPLQIRAERYGVAVEEWNIHRDRSRALLGRYFGGEAMRSFEKLHEDFLRIGGAVERLPNGRDISGLKKQVQSMNGDIYEFNLLLLSKLPRPALTRPN